MFEFGTFVDTEMLPPLFRIAFIYGWTTFFSLTKLVPSLNVFKRVLTGIRPFPFDETFIIQNLIFSKLASSSFLRAEISSSLNVNFCTS